MKFKSEEQIFGVHELFRPENDQIDIDVIAVHGLGGHAIKSWSEDGKTCWLSDKNMLPKYMRRARILAYGYNGNVSSLGQMRTSKDRILQHAITLIQHIHSDRSLEDADRRPIIFLCHSLGGIIVKRVSYRHTYYNQREKLLTEYQALAYSSMCTSPATAHLRSIFTSTFGILFFGTPHHGSNKANLLSSLQKISSFTIPSSVLRMESSLIDALRQESEILQDINDQFAPLMREFRVFFFWEQERMKLKYTRDYIVEECSAAPILDNTERCGLTGDHRTMCKFGRATDQGFRTVVAAMIRYAKDGSGVVAKRWELADKYMRETRLREAMELNCTSNRLLNVKLD